MSFQYWDQWNEQMRFDYLNGDGEYDGDIDVKVIVEEEIIEDDEDNDEPFDLEEFYKKVNRQKGIRPLCEMLNYPDVPERSR